MYTLFKKEINIFFSSLIGYIVIIVFLLINGLFLWGIGGLFTTGFNILDFGYANIDGLFILAPFVFLFLIPAVTMRLFSDERKTGTIELIATQPLTDLQIIMAKYWAGFVIVIISILPTLIYFLSVYLLALPKGNVDAGSIWGSYLGLVFLGASFTAIGVFASSVTDNQIISFLIAVLISGFIYLGFELIYSFDLFGNFDLFIKSLGMNTHYASISRGVIDTRDLIYFLSIIVLFILLTKISLESRKW